MSHCPRWYLPKLVYEVTIRTLHGTFWLRPDPECAAIVAGVFGRALRRYPGVRLHGFDAQSNHLHYLLSATEPAQIPLFVGFAHSNIARQINKLRGRTGVFWSRRSKVIAVLDDEAQLDRMTYLLSQGPKSKLVASPKDWPGACSTPGLLGDMTVPARYKGLDACRRNRLRRTPRPEAELEEDVQITLTPLPAIEGSRPTSCAPPTPPWSPRPRRGTRARRSWAPGSWSSRTPRPAPRTSSLRPHRGATPGRPQSAFGTRSVTEPFKISTGALPAASLGDPPTSPWRSWLSTHPGP
jgi:hypothetical protein